MNPFPAKKFNIIYADPPWAYNDKGCNGSAEKHYPTMKTKDLCALPVNNIAADNAVLFMWATWPFMPDALRVMDAWGFKYKTCAFNWVKTTKKGLWHFGTGHYTRANTEPCLLGMRGRLPVLRHTERQLVIDMVKKHSAKPLEVMFAIERLFGNLPAIELFARVRYPGWESWGNEV